MPRLAFLYNKYALSLYYVLLFAALAFAGAITLTQLVIAFGIGLVIYLGVMGAK